MSKCPENVTPITKDILLSMLKRENELRLSDEILDLLEKEASDEFEYGNFINYRWSY